MNLKRKVVKISDMKISSNVNEYLVTYSLGSCIAVSSFDTSLKIGAMIHLLLPDSSIIESISNPFKFADTGIPLMLKRMAKLGCKKKNLITKISGGANVMNKNSFFDVGKKNYLAVRRILWMNNIMINGEDVGGTKSRTVKLFIKTGKTSISNSMEEYEI